MTTNMTPAEMIEALVKLVDEDPRFGGRSAREVLCSLYDYETGSTTHHHYEASYFAGLLAAENLLEGPEFVAASDELARTVDSLIAFVDAQGDDFNE